MGRAGHCPQRDGVLGTRLHASAEALRLCRMVGHPDSQRLGVVGGQVESGCAPRLQLPLCQIKRDRGSISSLLLYLDFFPF